MEGSTQEEIESVDKNERDALSSYKNLFAKNASLIHLNNAGLAPISRVAKEKIEYWANRFYQEGFFTDADYMKDVAFSRSQVAQLIGCRLEEVSFFTSTAGGINQFAFTCGLKEQDEVLMWNQEYSSHLYPWKAACDAVGAKIVLVESPQDFSTPTELFLKKITSKTRVVAFSWVQFQTGAMMDTEAVIRYCKEKNILVFVDAMQGLGILDCHLWGWGVDAVVGGSHKWLVSPVGVGFLAIRNPLKFPPLHIGAYTYGTCDDPSDFACEPKKDASRFEPGSKQVLEITALGASLAKILEVGVPTIRKECLRLAQDLTDSLSVIGYKRVQSNGTKIQHPICNFTLPNDLSMELVTQVLSKNNINFARRGPGLRLSPYVFNTDLDFARTTQVLGEL